MKKLKGKGGSKHKRQGGRYEKKRWNDTTPIASRDPEPPSSFYVLRVFGSTDDRSSR
jgi:hypothetical protein